MNRLEMEFDAVLKASAALQGFGPPEPLREGGNRVNQPLPTLSAETPKPLYRKEHPMTTQQTPVDLRAVKFNQATIVAVSSLSILLGLPVLLVPLAAVLFAGTFNPKLALFKRLFSEVLRPGLNLPKAEVLDDPRAHNFAQGMVAATTLLAYLSHLANAPLLATAILGMNIALCLLSITASYCVGCQMYFRYRRLRWLVNR